MNEYTFVINKGAHQVSCEKLEVFLIVNFRAPWDLVGQK